MAFISVTLGLFLVFPRLIVYEIWLDLWIIYRYLWFMCMVCFGVVNIAEFWIKLERFCCMLRVFRFSYLSFSFLHFAAFGLCVVFALNFAGFFLLGLGASFSALLVCRLLILRTNVNARAVCLSFACSFVHELKCLCCSLIYKQWRCQLFWVGKPAMAEKICRGGGDFSCVASEVTSQVVSFLYCLIQVSVFLLSCAFQM